MAAGDSLKDFVGHEWRWLLLYVMLAFVMYWTALVIEPTYHLLREQDEQTKLLEKLLSTHANVTQEKIEGLETILTSLDLRAVGVRNAINSTGSNITIVDLSTHD